MMRFFIILGLLFFTLYSFSQEIQNDSISVKVDSLYREDQFYFSFAYNNFQNKPNGLSQGKFSPNISVGFLRDMPINYNRTFAIAAGFGYSLNVYNSNLQTSIDDFGNGKQRSYSILNNTIFFSKNKLSLHYIDLPIELRWRTSTPESHKFWRVYLGASASYLFADKYKFEGNGVVIKDKKNKDINKFKYSTYIAAGWNTWNAYIAYRFNSIYNDAQIDGEKINLTSLNLGLLFYIL